MPRLASVLLLLAIGCSPSARERDCTVVREILEPLPEAPRRTYDYSHRPAPLPPSERLRQTTWSDDEVRAAVQAVLAEPLGYSTYRREGAPPSAADRLAQLCGLHRLTLIVDE